MIRQFCTLVKKDMIQELENRNIIIEPILEKDQIHSTHVDLRLDNRFAKFKTFEEPYIDPAEELKNVEFLEKEFNFKIEDLMLE